MARELEESGLKQLPTCAVEFINHVIKKMRYRRKVRRDVRAELTSHFEDELKGFETDEQRQKKAQELIADFGDVKLLGFLFRRAKKRCRPLWQKVLVRGFAVVGVIFAYMMFAAAYLGVGRPNISVNYIEWLNDRVRAERPESKNAFPLYKKAVEAHVKMPDWLSESVVKWPGDFDERQRELLANWIDDNKKALDLTIEGTKKPYYWAVYNATENDLSTCLVDTILMENLAEYRTLARALNWRSRYKAYEGDVESALADCISSVKFGRHQEGKGLLIEQLVGIAIEAIAQDTILTIVEKTDVRGDVLKGVQQELQGLYREPRPVVSLDAERAFWYDYIQRTFTDDGEGGGRVLARGLPLVMSDWKSGLWRFLSMSYPDRREVTARIDGYFKFSEELLEDTPWRSRLSCKSETLNQFVKDCLLMQIMAPALDKVAEVGWRLKADRLALLTVLAVLRYEKDKGHLPEDMYAFLQAGYLREMPMDPYSDKPLVYRRTDGNFILYSLGLDFVDDGGEVMRDDEGRPRRWGDTGDRVFWPASKSQTNQRG